ncbi:hypothetical protein [Rhabdothermincola salaria]|uniref:hypothetical protein n=1 Tax=Rhabdothermincola salaria TaxID=2903142 RepID=UPI001E60639B|nr:hypothetical protein [Rhabdothermincola salaria]MCD9624349.1 hypothetical protein [Rhabdothermincola salaria]
MLEILSEPPRDPRDPSLFSSNTLFGEPGIYPQGPPMAPAPKQAPTEAHAREALERVVEEQLRGHGSVPGAAGALVDRLEDRDLVGRVPSPGLRAAVVLLGTTLAGSVLDAFAAGRQGPARLTVEPMPESGRIMGPHPTGDRATRALNDRYAGEHPALVTPSLAHDLLWSGRGTCQGEEVVLHALLAMVHIQLIARSPWLAHLGTELSRRQNSLAVTLLDSRRPGSASISVVAPDGPGTIPGGAPGMQTPDFWSIPFVAGPPEVIDAPSALEGVLDEVTDGQLAPARPRRYDTDLAEALSVHLGRSWLSAREQLRASLALGLLDVDDVARRLRRSVEDAVRTLELDDVVECWTPTHP